MKRSAIVLFFAAVMLLTTVAFAVEHDSDISSVCLEGYTGSEAEAFAPEGSFKLPMEEGTWSTPGTDAETHQGSLGEVKLTEALIPGELSERGEFTFEIEAPERTTLSRYARLDFGLAADGSDELMDLRVQLVTTLGTYDSYVYFTPSTDKPFSLITVNVSSLVGELLRIRVTLFFDEAPGLVAITEPCLSAGRYAGFEFARYYYSADLSAEAGEFDITTGTAVPDGGRVTLRGDLLTDTLFYQGGDAFFNIEVSGIISGSMVFSVYYRDGEYFRSQKLTVSPEREIYTIPIRTSGTPVAYSLEFSSIRSNSGTFSLSSVSALTSAYTLLESDSTVGRVTKISRQGSVIKFSGEVERGAILDYSTDLIHFYAVPSPFSGIEDAVHLGSTKVSTRFDYSVDVSGLPMTIETYAFFAGVVRENGRIVPISSPVYCGEGETKESDVSNVGLYDASAVGAFEANASQVIVDIPLSELLTDGSDSGDITVSYNVYALKTESGGYSTKKFTISSEVMEQLEHDIDFYLSVGISVYLRFTSTEPIKGLTYNTSGADNYMINPTYIDGRQKYAAIVKHFATRFPDIDGVVVGDSLNSVSAVGRSTLSDTAQYATEVADLCRITYNIITQYTDGAILILPFEERGAVPQSSRIEPNILSTMIASKLTEIGEIPWAYMYIVNSVTSSFSAPEVQAVLLDDLGIGRQTDTMYLYEPTREALMTSFREAYSETGVTSFSEYVAGVHKTLCDRYKGVRAVFLSMTRTDMKNNHDFYSALKSASETEGLVYESTADTVDKDIATGSSYAIWSFTDKYHPMGWIPGGGVTGCITDYSSVFSDYLNRSARSLKVTLDESENGVAGITLCNFASPVDLSAVDSIDFSMALRGTQTPSGPAVMSDITVVFVLGSDDHRAEYYLPAMEPERVYELSCDLTGYPYRDKVDYVGIMIYSDTGVSMELSSVDLRSDYITGAEMAEMFENNLAGEAHTPDYGIVAVVVMLLFALSVTVFILIVRYDREEKLKRTGNFLK